MSKKVVIIESPGKKKKFQQALGSEYVICPTVGHCVDLPEKSLSISIKDKFEPTFEVKSDKKEVVKNIKSAIKGASDIYLMTDEDREGEAIAWHIKNLLSTNTKANWHRSVTNEITKKGILNAINNPGEIDQKKINAYLCRRLLDRLCGYKTSYLTKQATGGRSAGRVQSAMLRIIVDRELEIKNFKPEEYWLLKAKFETPKKDQYEGLLDEKIKVPNEKKAVQIYESVKKSSPHISSVEKKKHVVKSIAPFVTATMVQSASSIFGWGVKRTEKAAQKLYEAGLITYMRTDSPFMASEAIDSIRDYITSNFDSSYVPKKSKQYSSKKGSQEAHECCRPTDIAVTSASSGDEAKLYELIWRRAVSSQMADGSDERTKVITQCGEYDFITKGKTVIFDGFRKVWHYSMSDDVILPKSIEQNIDVKLVDLSKDQKFTTPPPRYSDASLSKKCEKEQVSRPATFGNFVEALKNRKYITAEKKSFVATDLGIKVIDFLKKADMCFVDIKFTSDMETLLDNIAQEKSSKEEVLNEFWARLQEDIKRGNDIKSNQQKTSHKCPKCSGFLMLKHSKYGAFFSCENYSNKEKKCEYKASVGENNNPVEKSSQKEYVEFKCPKCSNKMIKRKSKYGEFAGCSKFPGCKVICDLEGNITSDGTSKKTKKKWTKKAKKKLDDD